MGISWWFHWPRLHSFRFSVSNLSSVIIAKHFADPFADLVEIAEMKLAFLPLPSTHVAACLAYTFLSASTLPAESGVGLRSHQAKSRNGHAESLKSAQINNLFIIDHLFWSSSSSSIHGHGRRSRNSNYRKRRKTHHPCGLPMAY